MPPSSTAAQRGPASSPRASQPADAPTRYTGGRGRSVAQTINQKTAEQVSSPGAVRKPTPYRIQWPSEMTADSIPHVDSGALADSPACAVPPAVRAWTDGEAERDSDARAAGPGRQEHVADAGGLASDARFGLGGAGRVRLAGHARAVVAAPALLAAVYADKVLELLPQSGDSDSAAGGRSGRDRGVGDRRHSRPARPDRRAARAGAQLKRRRRTAPQAREQLSSGAVAALSVLDLLGGLKLRKAITQPLS